MAITIEDVRAAFSTLKTKGEKATVANVRARLGRGSFNTLGPLVRAVKDEEAATAAEARLQIDDDVPAEVVAKIVEAARTAGAEAYRAMVAPLEARIRETKAFVASERTAMRFDLDQMLAESSDANERAEKLQIELITSREALASTTAQLAAALEQQRTAADHHKEELNRALAQGDKFQVELSSARSRVEALLVELGELRGQLSTAKSAGHAATE